ncbi:formate dehydrogenase [Aggregicoccus sp. 17bor-14]|uniref:NrfD/PsrC family molybdoenzyme membrane anchor subunit n=1 Tax=Myxococcaceae TaxID=31 RepID=UPI00129D0E3B|nr:MULTISPECIES: NrfD/PsrC family molybdoenzyme membrane anchor subunit [Myxococcaceae]MBF5043871.1 polysulfide reductase NrfD [Simulacricoccus sp. 17bor-14]MRI89623.1 formate dehydrogenase [Aggregicoccus sp. 17bor-14]
MREDSEQGKSTLLERMERTGDGRNIEPALGLLEGEGAQQRVRGAPEPRRERRKTEHAIASRAETADPLHPSYYGLPVIKETVWIWTIPLYFHVGGLAGAASVLGVSAELAGGRRFRRLRARTRWTGAVGDAVSAVLLITDLGRPERFLNMMRVFRPSSPMSMGSWVLSVSGAANGLAAVTSGFEGGVLGRSGDAASVVGGVLGLPLAGYTAVLLANTAVPVWQGTRFGLPLLFMSAGVASAASLLSLLPGTRAEGRALHLYGTVGSAAALAATYAVEREAARSESVSKHLHAGVGGALWRAAKACTAAGLALSLLPGRTRAKRVAASVLTQLGSLGMRYGIFYAGKASARDPQATFRAQREGLGAAEVQGQVGPRPDLRPDRFPLPVVR